MPQIKFQHIISCSSEDPNYVANNLLNNDSDKKWKNKTKGEQSAVVIFQLDKERKISGIDIGNECSSFVEVFVSKSSCPDDFQILLAMSSFMTPMEARNLNNCNRVRMFTYSELASPARDEKWDRVKVVCTQPFNKQTQYGLSFITLRSPQEQTNESCTSIGKFVVRPESPLLTAGSLFSKRNELDKEKNEQNVTVAQAIKTNDKPACKPINITPSNSKAAVCNKNKEKDRNRKDLFFDSDDEAANNKIDKLIEKVKQERSEKEAKTPPVKKTNDNKANKKTKETPKRKLEETPSTSKKKVKLITKPFNELLSGVIFTISGIVNPERTNLRKFALAMGAKYKPDWDDTCTHLVCAFANTPKYQQVHGKGKIITKSWIKDCYDHRKRLPWRRYALDQTEHGKPESEDEIEERKQENNNILKELSGSDTEEEIEKILTKQKENKDDPFVVETDEEKLDKNPADLPEIPKLFKTDVFYVDDVFGENEKNKLERLIKTFDGVVLTTLRNITDFVITNEDSVENIRKQCPNAKFVRPNWIYECHDVVKLIPVDKFLLI